jgi:lipopolysaccharide export system permease protein
VKILDKYLLKSFLITFTTVFVILFFIFVLQVVWLFISELAGKDLDFIMILKFLLFKMPSIIPLVLPLSVLLASIMTFGSLAENYEFAAMKSSGISLQRAMRSLIYFIAILSIIAFIFANNVIPFAEYKFVNFRRNIAQVKPALAIAEGQFSQVGSYNIKVEKKSGENGKYLKGVTIHKLSNIGSGSNTVIKAKSGELVSSETSNILKLILKDGNYYEDIIPKKIEERHKVPFAKSEFKRYVINIDLSKLNKANMDEAQITNTNTMLTIGELRFTLDSLQKNYKKDLISIAENTSQRTAMNPSYTVVATNSKPIANTILDNYSNEAKTQILRVASSNVDATTFSLSSSAYEIEDKLKNISQHWIALYDKFVIAYSCLLMFFIGAPLGAIIRKGGLGLPIVFAVLIFIIFHFINTFGKKVAQQNEIDPFLGSWMSSFVLTPLAILLTKKATDDKGFNISFDWLNQFINRIFTPKKESELLLNTMPSSGDFELKKEVAVVENKVSKPIKINTPKKEFTSIHSLPIKTLIKQYKRYSLVSMIGYLIMLILVFTADFNTNSSLIPIVLCGVLFVIFVYKAQTLLYKIGVQTATRGNLQTLVVILGYFPFYPLFYFYNLVYIKDLQTQS